MCEFCRGSVTVCNECGLREANRRLALGRNCSGTAAKRLLQRTPGLNAVQFGTPWESAGRPYALRFPRVDVKNVRQDPTVR